ncbi:MAG TPA: PilZ domain-containing protein [Polyangia bacterium]|nr:PilZ domain-containing protein [Polyangia bacterium]
MGAWLGRRSEPRVDYREPVRVLWPGEVSGVRARAINLSPAGILVDAPTPTPCAVGSDVLCDVALPRNGQVLLRGRVAHRRLLSAAKVGMGIEFVDLSPMEAAELRDLVDAGHDKPQRVLVHFAGTNQTVRARAHSTAAGLRLTTTLPFLKRGTALDLSLTTDGAAPHARGQVTALGLETNTVDGIPRLLIDVDLDEASVSASVDDSVGAHLAEESDVAEPTPVGESMAATLRQAVPAEIPEHVWEADELASEEAITTVDLVTPPPRTRTLSMGATPTPLNPEDLTQLVSAPPRPRRASAIIAGMLVGAAGLIAFGPTLARRVSHTPVEPPAMTPPSQAVAAPAPVAAPPTPPPTPPPPAPVEAAPTEAVVPVPADEPAPPADPPPAAKAASGPPHFTVGITGSLAGAVRYPLSSPDGVAFNLPHAQPTLKLGVYETALKGVRAVWVRPLAGGGTHVRVLFTASRPVPKVALRPDGVVVTASR